jgi:type I restriction enzyme S subunit
MKKGRMSESGFLGLKDEQDLTTKKIFKSSNLVNPDSDNMKGWEIKKLGEVCDLTAGGDVPKDDFSEFQTVEKKVPIYANGEKNDGLYGYTSIGKITKPSITVSARGTIGFSVKRLHNFYPIVRLITVTPKDLSLLDLAFLDYSIKGIDFKHSGSSIPQLTIPMIRDYELPLPPLPEQQRIVAILDEAFAAIAKAKANAQQNLQNAKELFESYLQGVFENKMSESGFLGLKDEQDLDNKKSKKEILKSSNLANPDSDKGEGWEEKTLGEMIEIKNGKNQQAVLSATGQYKVMGSAGNVMGYAIDFICEAGTTIIGRKGNISKPIYIEERFWNVDTAFGFFPKNENDIDKRFVYYLCLGIDFKSMNRGTTIPSLVKSELQTIQIAFPKSLKTQQTIVQKLDALNAETKKLESIYQQKIKDLEELKKSVLQKAFSGQLKTVRGEV